MTEGPPNPAEQNPEVIALRKDMENLEERLGGDIRELKAGVERDIDYLKRLVWALIGGIIAVIAGVVARAIGFL